MKAKYYGHSVIVTHRRAVTGGVICDVERDPEEKNWPWTVERFTTAESILEYDDDDKENIHANLR